MSLIIDGVNGVTFPSWTTATRPVSPSVGLLGYNTTTGLFDQYTVSGWNSISTSSSLTIQYNGSTIGSATTLNLSTNTTATISGSVVTVSSPSQTGKAIAMTIVFGG